MNSSPARSHINAASLTRRIATAIILLTIIIISKNHIWKYLEWPPAAYSNNLVYNLTKEKIKWDIYYGSPEICGKLECHLMTDYSSANFTKQEVLPTREFPLKNFKTGQIIYYRTTITLPAKLMDPEEPILFHSIMIWAKKYQFYVNGKFVDSGANKLLNISIPKHLVPADGKLTLVFRVDPGSLRYQGIAHMGDLVIGPKHLLSDLDNFAHDFSTLYYTWHILPRLTVCIVFALFFLSVSRNSELFMFVIYAFVGSAYVYLQSALPESIFGVIEAKDNAVPVLQVFCSLVFFALVHRFYRCQVDRRYRLFLLVGIGVLIGAVVVAVTNDAGAVHFILNRVNFAIRILGGFYAAYLSFRVWHYLNKSGISQPRQYAALIFGIFNVIACFSYILTVLSVIGGSLGPTVILVSDTILLIVFAGLIGQDFGQTITQRDDINRNFRKFLGNSVAERIVSEKNTLTPRESIVSVMFCDIRSFTTMCEGAKPGEIFAFLNEYFELMISVISDHGGVVDKFGGDSIMALWGVPKENPQHALEASRCSLAMREALRSYNKVRASAGKGAVRIGIGIHSGVVMAGALGSQERQEYTVIGDTVNIASRLEGLTKVHNIDIILSGTTWKMISGYATGHSIGSAKVKGKAELVDIYSIDEIQLAA